jgi:hypothetical protein
LDLEVAFILSATGGALIFLQSVLLLSAAHYPLAAAGTLSGALIVAAAGWFRSRIRRRRELGMMIVVVALISFFTISGFFLGALLALVGGLLAITARGSRFLNPRTSMLTSQSLGPPCPRCGKGRPSWTSKWPYCAYPD